jgi:hypothetical protein
MSGTNRHSMSHQPNAIVGLIGLVIMLGGGALIVTVLTIYGHHPYHVEFLMAGSVSAIVGLLLQYVYGRDR